MVLPALLAPFVEPFRGKQRGLFFGMVLLALLYMVYVFFGKNAFQKSDQDGHGVLKLLNPPVAVEPVQQELGRLRTELKKLEQSGGAGAVRFSELQGSIAVKTAVVKILQQQRVDQNRAVHYARYWGWFLSGFLLLFVLPVLVIGLHPRLSLADYGLGLGDWRFALKVLAVFVALMVGLVVLMVLLKEQSFLAYYPMFARSGAPHGETGFLSWFLFMEFTYLLYFVGWEFFYRSLLIFPFEKQLGAAAVLPGILPFMMMHLGKPPLETLGSIVAAVALGLLVLRVRSFWVCAVIHFMVAGTMDLAAALEKGLF